MLQRKQTIFLLLAFVAIVACIVMPIGWIVPEGDQHSLIVYNFIVSSVGELSSQMQFVLMPFALLLLTSALLSIWTIFKYRTRPLQALLCLFLAIFMIAWVAYYVVMFFIIGINGATFHPAFGAALPIVAAILFLMARSGILADERLVRAADRIR